MKRFWTVPQNPLLTSWSNLQRSFGLSVTQSPKQETLVYSYSTWSLLWSQSLEYYLSDSQPTWYRRIFPGIQVNRNFDSLQSRGWRVSFIPAYQVPHSFDFLEKQKSMLSTSSFIAKSFQKFVHTVHFLNVFFLTLFSLGILKEVVAALSVLVDYQKRPRIWILASTYQRKS